ncbi:hypothetical protein [Bosea sp. CS1GBMeth4]|uniref:hypothetical protein n=1 Tax=Bosea sp. CS1GBMeth4 TaxID=1892849 RepID=UPI001FCE937B|nr:hypothetical protein [Bosea sp. CS1GBMeth4]
MKVPVALALAAALAGCSVDMGGFSFVSNERGTRTSSASARISTQEAMLTPEGECSADVSLDPSTRPLPKEIAVGITECELVRLKNKRPTDVLIGESGKGQREVQVLYAEPGGRELYLFTDNRLSRIVKPGQGEQQG